MDNFKFTFNDKEYTLSKENCDYILLEDDENEISGLDISDILSLLNECKEVQFDKAYYREPCEKCLKGKEERLKHFKFLEYYFYIFTKDNKYVMSNISKEFESTNFTQLLKLGKVDNSYALMIMVCENCGSYSIEIEQCDI